MTVPDPEAVPWVTKYREGGYADRVRVTSYSIPSGLDFVVENATWLVTKQQRLDILVNGHIVAQFGPGSWQAVGSADLIPAKVPR